MFKLAIVFVVLFFCTAPARADGGEDEHVWLDEMHRQIGDSVNASAQWFDNFFSTNQQVEDEKATGHARIRLAWEPRSRDWDDFEARIRVRVKLPKLKNRVDLILADYEDEHLDDKVRAGRAEDANRQEKFNIAFRFKRSPDSGLSHRLGIGRRLQLFAKTRYRDKFQLAPDTDLRWDASVYYYNRDGLGADTGLTLDHHWGDDMLFRFDNRFYFRDQSSDWLWQHSLQHFQQFKDNSALILGYYVEGLSRPNYRLEEYLVSTRYRQQFLRDWLFFEVEPFVLWRRAEGFSASYGVALRLEGHFGGH